MIYFLILASSLLIYMNIWFIFSIIKKRNDIADEAWGLGFVLLAWLSLLISKDIQLQNLIINIIVSIWGLRLFYHIHSRHKNKNEDSRYAEWRENWKNFYLRSYFQIYILQGIFLFIIAIPILTTNKNPVSNLSYTIIIGFLVWVTGFLFEAIADKQLSTFIKDPNNKGKLLTTGLWKYSRHPNYFGEVIQWWGVWIIAFQSIENIFTIISPITISILIIFVSGIPLLENKYKNRPDFIEYKNRTSIFFPLPPKK